MRLQITMLALLLAGIGMGCAAPPRPPATALPGQSAVEQAPVETLENVLCGSAVDVDRAETDRRRRQALQDALRSRLQAGKIAAAPDMIARAATCLTVSPVEGSGGKVLWVARRPADFAQKDMFAVWFFDGAWRVDHLPVDEYGTLPYPRYYSETPGGAEVISLGRNGGSGHAGSYSLIRFGTGMKVLWQSALYGYLDDHSINDHLLRATYRDPQVSGEPHAYGANCCYPTNRQAIWERQGDVFVVKAVRNYPSVLRTASAFAGAWNEGQLDRAAAYAANGTVVTTMAGDVRPPLPIMIGPEPANLWTIEKAEEAYWDALPPAYSGPQPSVFEVVWPATPRPLLLKRMDGQWKVAGWQ